MAPSVGRKFADARQRLKGRQPLTFQLEVVPYFAGTVAEGLRQSVLWGNCNSLASWSSGCRSAL